jgi:predicted nucleic acid-binding protein
MEEGAPADASSLIYLAKADAFPALAPVVGSLLAPPEVWFEAVEEGERIGAPEVPRIHEARELGLLDRVSLDASERRQGDRLREQGLGRDECEVLAIGARTQTVVIDEGRGSRIARARGLEPISTLQLVVLAFRRGSLDARRAHELARELAGVMNVTAEVFTAIGRRLSDEW